MNSIHDLSDLGCLQTTAEVTAPIQPYKPLYRPQRYFEAPLPEVTCFNCGEAGHMSNTCMHPGIRKRCVYCGTVGHRAATCPEAVCVSCGLTGHIPNSCKVEGGECTICQQAGHRPEECLGRGDALEERETRGLRCLLKGCKGHCTCYQLQGYSRLIYCCKCGNPGHTFSQCP